ncbi:MAG: hypothetical protein F4Y16_02430, partial [Holophagales bacterium]|nr:hypothetical protein [Holophagales bacterium]
MTLRRSRLRGCLFPVVPAALFLAAGSVHANVCDRTAKVRDAIVAASGVAACGDVADRNLRDVTTLDLSDGNIASLAAGDFDGLVRLESLDLSGNLLASLPSGIFDELYLLETLLLDGNELASLDADTFEQLFMLEELTLHDNELTSLPDGMFDEFSWFDGTGADGSAPDNSGSYPRIQRFLDRHDVTSPEEFVAALPELYQERFAIMYQSKALARDHVSVEHPRIVSWGAHGQIIFAWNTDPDAPSNFRDAVEFLRPDDTDWTAGIIDFSGSEPSISEPTSCQTCHGSLKRPIWGIYAEWEGSEYDYILPRARNMETFLSSTDARITPLEVSSENFRLNEEAVRYLMAPHGELVVAGVEEAGAVWSFRHAEVLLRILKSEDQDFRSWAREQLCNGGRLHKWFDQEEHNLVVRTDTDIVTRDGVIVSGVVSHVFGTISDVLRRSYLYHQHGNLADALELLIITELWKAEPIVRRLYRGTTNGSTVDSGIDASMKKAMLHYASGSATAEDELIQKLRLHFGRGGEAALEARARQSERFGPGGVISAIFGDGHTSVMKGRVCRALGNSAPEGLTVSQEAGNAVLNWSAPTYDVSSVTGYRILRGSGGGTPVVHVSDTGSTATTWSEASPPLGDYSYVVRTIYDGYYESPASQKVETTVVAFPEAVANLTVDAQPASVTLRWDAPGGATAATGYRIRRGALEDSLDVLVADTGATATSHVDTAVVEGGTYFYSVAALNGKAAGPESGTVRADVPRSKPTEPVLGAVTAARGALTVSWTEPADTGATAITSYDLRYIPSENVDKADANWTVRTGIWSSGALEYSLSGLTDDTGYDLQVRAVNGAGGGPWSGTGSGTTLPNRAPEAAGSLADRELRVGDGNVVVEVSGAFEDPDGDSLTYGASSGSPAIVRTTVSGSRVTLRPVSAGTAVVTVTATDVTGSNTEISRLFNAVVAAARAVTASRAALTVREGGTGSYTIVLESAPTGSVSVTPSVAGNVDVAVSPPALTFTAGTWSRSRTVTVEALDDADALADPPVTVRHHVAGADYGSVPGPEVVVTIVETDTPTLAVDAAEAGEQAGVLTFRVTLSTASSDDVTVEYATSDGAGVSGATSGSDYEAVTGTLTFRAGTTSAQHVDINLLDDAEDEEERETFRLTLRNPRNAALAGGGSTLDAVGTILDDDDPEVGVSFASSNYEVAEGAAAVVVVQLDRDPEREVSVSLNRAHRGGTTAQDYSGIPGEVVFAAGLMKAEFLFTATDDSVNDDE